MKPLSLFAYKATILVAKTSLSRWSCEKKQNISKQRMANGQTGHNTYTSSLEVPMEQENGFEQMPDAAQDNQLYQPEKKPANKNLLTALIIGGIALAIIVVLVLVLVFAGKGGEKSDPLAAYDFAPATGATVITLNLDANLGDTINTVMPMIKERLTQSGAPAEVGAILDKLPNLEFLNLSGFAVIDPRAESAPLIGLELSGRKNPESAYTEFLNSLAFIPGSEIKNHEYGYSSLVIEGEEVVAFYLDAGHMLIGKDRDSLAKAVSTRIGKIGTLKSNPKWPRIEKNVLNSPIAFCSVFSVEGKEFVITGNVTQERDSYGFKVSWLDGTDQLGDLVKTLPKSAPNITDLLKWQKDLSKAISSMPDSQVRFAVPFIIKDENTFVDGQMAGYLDLSTPEKLQAMGLEVTGTDAVIDQLMNFAVLDTSSIVEKQADGSFKITRKPYVIEPARPVNPPDDLKPPQKLPEKTETEVFKPKNPILNMFENFDRYFIKKASTGKAVIASTKDGLNWKSGKTEKISGSILSVAIDGKLLINQLLQSVMESGDMESLPDIGAQMLLLGPMLEKLDPRLFVDVLTESKDIVLTISIKFDPNFGF
jgi:hypothetical protein